MAVPDMYKWAERLIDKYGRDVILQVLSEVPAEADKPWKGNKQAVTTQYEDRVAVIPAYTMHNNLGILGYNTDLLQRFEELIICPPTENYDNVKVIIDGGTKWRVEWTSILRPGNETILYLFGVKR